MSKPIPHVSKFMSAMPHTIGPDQPIALARDLMREMHVRHLPVRYGEKLVGLLSERDIDLLLSFPDIDLARALVKDAMSLDPYTVVPDAPLDEVCSHMAEGKIGSALVVQENGTLVGIFTAVDGLRALSELLFTRLKK